MPAITRSQSKIMRVNGNKPAIEIYVTQVSKPIALTQVSISDKANIERQNFINKTKELLYLTKKANNKTNKVLATIDVFEYVNTYLLELFNKNMNDFITFVAVAYRKAYKYLLEIRYGGHNDVDANLLKKLMKELIKTAELTKPLLVKYSYLKSNRYIDEALIYIRSSESVRSRRPFVPVNYSDMDMTEDDEGETTVYKRWFENDEVRYKGRKVPLPQINDYGDEDFDGIKSEDLLSPNVRVRKSPRKLNKVNYAELDEECEE